MIDDNGSDDGDEVPSAAWLAINLAPAARYVQFMGTPSEWSGVDTGLSESREQFMGTPSEWSGVDTGLSESRAGPASEQCDHASNLNALIKAGQNLRQILRHLHAVWHEPKWGRPWVESLRHNPVFSKQWWKELDAERDAKLFELCAAYIVDEIRKEQKIAYAGAEQKTAAIEEQNKRVHSALLDHDRAAPVEALTAKGKLIRDIVVLCFGEIPGLEDVRKILRAARREKEAELQKLDEAEKRERPKGLSRRC